MNQPAALFPSFARFAEGLNSGKHQLVWSKLVVDTETPVSAMLKLEYFSGPRFLLESVEGGEVRGRYSIIGLDPDLMFRARGAQAEISRTEGFPESSFVACAEPTLAALSALVDASHIELPPELPPMASALVGYGAYDLVKQMERLPDANPDPIAIPDACFMRPRVMLIFDAVAGIVFIATPIWATPISADSVQHGDARNDAESAYEAAERRISQVMDALARPLSPAALYAEKPTTPPNFTSNLTREAYHAMVEKAKTYIAAGDIFQVVPSQRFSAPFTLPPMALYRAIRHLNPSPFLFCLQFSGFALVGASPEILVRVRDGKVTIRPIAGTRKRGKTREEDAELAADLLSDPKEIAEHLMLLDLGRNDVGRISKTGTVRVTEQMKIEHYSHVMHIVSNVEGEIDPRFSAVEALVAGFPAGTVSGAPKIRAMEIIDELEPVRRSFYGGGVGYISANGAMDTCIALRTGLIKNGVLYVQAGGGVVADSDPEAEYQESCNKAKALMRAAEEAIKFA